MGSAGGLLAGDGGVNIFPQHVLDSLVGREYVGPDGEVRRDGRDDAPGSMLAWAVEGRMLEQPHLFVAWLEASA